MSALAVKARRHSDRSLQRNTIPCACVGRSPVRFIYTSAAACSLTTYPDLVWCGLPPIGVIICMSALQVSIRGIRPRPSCRPPAHPSRLSGALSTPATLTTFRCKPLLRSEFTEVATLQTHETFLILQGGQFLQSFSQYCSHARESHALAGRRG